MKNHLSIIFTMTLLSLTAGCVTLTPVGNAVKEAKNESDVSNCKLLGEVFAPPPFMLPTDAKYTLRNEVGKLGGNTLLVTDHLVGTAKGKAYSCG